MRKNKNKKRSTKPMKTTKEKKAAKPASKTKTVDVTPEVKEVAKALVAAAPAPQPAEAPKAEPPKAEPPKMNPDPERGPNEKFPFGMLITDGARVYYDRYKTAAERKRRVKALEKRVTKIELVEY